MKRNHRNRLKVALIGALATIGSLHAPLHAEETTATVEAVRVEVIRTDHEAAAAEALKAVADAALEQANDALRAELAIELELRLGGNATPVVADNE